MDRIIKSLQGLTLLAANTFATDGLGEMEAYLERLWTRKVWEGKAGTAKQQRGGHGKQQSKGGRQGRNKGGTWKTLKSQIDAFSFGGDGDLRTLSSRVITTKTSHALKRSDHGPV